MAATRASLDDLDWMLDLLERRRAPLVTMAPVFWKPAADAAAAHRVFVEYQIAHGGARAYRTANAVLKAAPQGEGWLVDNAYVTDERWAETTDGRDLWNAFAADCAGSQVRFVAPTYERARCQFALNVGLTVQESWWLKELSSGGGQAGLTVELPGAAAVTLAAPPVYAPPGPVLFLPNPSDAALAVPAALAKAEELGCAAVVVNQPATNVKLAEDLHDAGLRRHCDFFTGVVAAV